MGMTELTIAVLPWLVTLLVFLVIVTYVPELSLWLPRMLGMLLGVPKVSGCRRQAQAQSAIAS